MRRKAGPISCTCNACGKDFFRQRNRGNMAVCSPCSSRQRVKAWKEANPERAKEINTQPSRESKRAWASRNLENGRQKARRHYWKDVSASRAKSRQRYASDRDRHIQRVVDRQNSTRTPAWADREQIAKIYARARALGKGYQVDHVVPIRGKTVCGLHVESNLQIVTALENRMKGNKFPTAASASSY